MYMIYTAYVYEYAYIFYTPKNRGNWEAPVPEFVYIYIYIYVYLNTYIHTYIHVHVCLYVYTSTAY